MSLNIAGDVVACCSKIEAVVSTNKLGPRQIKGFERMVRTGVIVGNALPQRLAKMVRTTHRLPVVHVSRYGSLHWSGVEKTNEGFFNALTACMVASQLDDSDSDNWKKRHFDENDKTLKKRPASGQLNYLSYGAALGPLKRVKLAEFEGEIPTTFVVDLLKGNL